MSMRAMVTVENLKNQRVRVYLPIRHFFKTLPLGTVSIGSDAVLNVDTLPPEYDVFVALRHLEFCEISVHPSYDERAYFTAESTQ